MPLQVMSVDLGKTGCRAALSGGIGHDGDGAPGLAHENGVSAAISAIALVCQELLQLTAVNEVAAISVGAAGALADPAAASELAELLLHALPTWQVAVTSDAVTSHAGALGGRDGVVLAVGTGAVAFALSPDGEFTQVDGWGPWLGDCGGGAWIGLAGLRAALAALDGRGPATGLQAGAQARFGNLRRLPATLSAGEQPARTAAAFAPDVAAQADLGDPVALGIIAAAVQALADTALTAAAAAKAGTAAAAAKAGTAAAAAKAGTAAAAARVNTAAAEFSGLPTVAITGGLVNLGPVFLAPLTELLEQSGVHLTKPAGTSLDGARLLATRRDTAFESLISRAVRVAQPVRVR